MDYKGGDVFKVVWNNGDVEHYMLSIIGIKTYMFICITPGKFCGGRLIGSFNSLERVEKELNNLVGDTVFSWQHIPECKIIVKEKKPS